MGQRMKVQQTLSIGDVANGVLVGLVRGQNKAAEYLLALSSVKVPMDDEGTLLASGTVNPATKEDEAAEVIYDTPYAARWHEDQPLVDSLGRRYAGNSNFQNGRSSHYLSEPAEQNAKAIVDIIRKEAKGG